MLPSNTSSSPSPSSSAAAAADNAVNGSACSVANGADDVNSTSDGSEETCFTPVTDPDSVALLAAMCEANRSVARSCRTLGMYTANSSV